MVIQPGDLVKVIIESTSKRRRELKGLCIKSQRGNFTIRFVLNGIAVEYTIFKDSPAIKSIEVFNKIKVRQSKLYYLRRKSNNYLAKLI